MIRSASAAAAPRTSSVDSAIGGCFRSSQDFIRRFNEFASASAAPKTSSADSGSGAKGAASADNPEKANNSRAYSAPTAPASSTASSPLRRARKAAARASLRFWRRFRLEEAPRKTKDTSVTEVSPRAIAGHTFVTVETSALQTASQNARVSTQRHRFGVRRRDRVRRIRLGRDCMGCVGPRMGFSMGCCGVRQ